MTDKEKKLKKQLRKLQKAFCEASLILSDTEFYNSIADKFDKDYPFDKSFDEMALEVDTWIEDMYPSLKIVKGTAIYTGGGIYIIVGKLNDGNYVVADDDYWDIYNDKAFEKVDLKKYEFIYDEQYNYDNSEWCDEHRISEQYQPNDVLRAIKKFCKEFDKGRENAEKYLIDEFKDSSNYAPGELTRMVYERIKGN